MSDHVESDHVMSINDSFVSDPTKANFVKMVECFSGSKSGMNDHERVLEFCEEITASHELFVCMSRELRPHQLKDALTALATRYTPSNTEVKEFSDTRPCEYSLRLHFERNMKLQNGTLQKIINYLPNAIRNGDDMNDALRQYDSMVKLCRENGYSIAFTKPEQKSKATRTKNA